MKQIETDNNLKVHKEEDKPVTPLNEELKSQISDSIKKVNLANETSVLMGVMCDRMELKSQGLTHAQFVEKFTQIQNDSLAAQKFLQQQFIIAPAPEKLRKSKIRNS